MGKTIAIVNQKGGVGKTTTCVNLAAALTGLGAKVLVCDFDPQGNATSGFGIDKTHSPNIYDVIMGLIPLSRSIVATKWADVVPSNKSLSGATVELISLDRREYRLRDAIEEVKGRYDFVFIDCPPSLELLTLDALCAADTLLVPVQCEYYALEGLNQVLKLIDLVRQKLNPGLYVEGVLFTMYDQRTRLSEQVVESVRDNLKERIFDTVIPRNVRLAEAPSFGEPINIYDSSSRGAESYRLLAAEILEREGREI